MLLGTRLARLDGDVHRVSWTPVGRGASWHVVCYFPWGPDAPGPVAPGQLAQLSSTVARAARPRSKARTKGRPSMIGLPLSTDSLQLHLR